MLIINVSYHALRLWLTDVFVATHHNRHFHVEQEVLVLNCGSSSPKFAIIDAVNAMNTFGLVEMFPFARSTHQNGKWTAANKKRL